MVRPAYLIGAALLFAETLLAQAPYVITQLTNNEEEDYFYAGWSPDGKQICFMREAEEQNDICLINKDGSGFRFLTNTPGFDENGASFSPDGQWVTYVANPSGHYEVYKMELASGDTVAITQYGVNSWLSSFSPDGLQIIFDSYVYGNADVFLMNTDGSNRRRLTSHEGYEAGARMSPTGKEVVFHRRAAADDYEIYLLDLGSGREEALTATKGDDSYADWSPDGERLVFRSTRTGQSDLFMVSRDGSDLQRLTFDPGTDYTPAFSPDGQTICFQSDRDGDNELYLMHLDRPVP